VGLYNLAILSQHTHQRPLHNGVENGTWTAKNVLHNGGGTSDIFALVRSSCPFLEPGLCLRCLQPLKIRLLG
jgi:hypothetical protein